jgi:fructosamine-3-kinase
MVAQEWLAEVAVEIGRHSGQPFELTRVRPCGGGCINQSLILESTDSRWFIKFNSPELLDMFEAEADGLAALAQGSIRAPRPLCSGISGQRAWLVLEYLPMAGGRAASATLAGQQLARLHAMSAEGFGWSRNNYIGATPQANEWLASWPDFWRKRRLEPQIELLKAKGMGGAWLKDAARLLDALPELLGHQPVPSLLHGDLWSGNLAYGTDGEPLIFDPAVYYGDREADLAMTELFGGFGQAFYQAYEEIWPLSPGYGRRKKLYNLYHILNHANLFGGSYLGQAQRIIRDLLG